MMTRYIFRSLWAQRIAAFPTVTAVFVSVAIVCSMSLITNNVARAVLKSGRTDNLMVRAREAETADDSDLPISLLGQLRALPGLADDGQGNQWTGELFAMSRLRRLDTGLPIIIKVRGVDPNAYAVHPDVHLLSGSIPARGIPGILVGIQLLNHYTGLVPGGYVRMGHNSWPVVGTFDARGTTYESEIWCDRTALAAAFDGSSFTTFVARTKDEQGMQAAIKAASAIRAPAVTAESEATYNARQTEELRPYILVAWILTGILMIGATFACVGTMNALFLSRRREFATLLAIGFTPGRLCVMLAMETAFLVGLGAVAGLATMALQFGRAYLFKDWHVVVRIQPAVTPILHGALVAGVVSFIGAVIAIIEIKRMVVLDALREA